MPLRPKRPRVHDYHVEARFKALDQTGQLGQEKLGLLHALGCGNKRWSLPVRLHALDQMDVG
jgi:hypothetical protein